MAKQEPFSLKQFSNITAALYRAATNPLGWQHFIEVLSEASGDVRTHMFGFDRTTDSTFDEIGHGYSPEIMDLYQRHYYKRNAWAPGFAQGAEGTTVYSQTMMPLDELEKTEFYNDWVRPQEDVCAGGGAVLFKSPARTILLGGNIRRKDTEKLESRWLNGLEILLPHIQNAFNFNRLIADQKLHHKLSQKGMTIGDGVAFFYVSPSLDLLYANEGAQRYVERGDIAWLSISGRLQFRPKTLRLALQRACAELVLLSSKISSQTIAHCATRGQIEMQIMRVSDQELLPPFVRGNTKQCLLVAISTSDSKLTRFELLKSQNGLTQAETDVLRGFSCAGNLKAVAEMRGASIYTVRNQIKSAMQKLHVRNQAELLRKILN